MRRYLSITLAAILMARPFGTHRAGRTAHKNRAPWVVIPSRGLIVIPVAGPASFLIVRYVLGAGGLSIRCGLRAMGIPMLPRCAYRSRVVLRQQLALVPVCGFECTQPFTAFFAQRLWIDPIGNVNLDCDRLHDAPPVAGALAIDR
jgi:hypothetical protein